MLCRVRNGPEHTSSLERQYVEYREQSGAYVLLRVILGVVVTVWSCRRCVLVTAVLMLSFNIAVGEGSAVTG